MTPFVFFSTVVGCRGDTESRMNRGPELWDWAKCDDF